MSETSKAVFKRCKQKSDKLTGKARPRSARRTFSYVLGEGAGKNAHAVTAVEGRGPGGTALFGDARLDSIAFASRAPVGRSEVGHYTLAAAGEGSPAKRLGLLRAGHAFARAYLDDDQGYMLVVHKDQHVHIIPELYNAAGRAFYVDDDLYAAMKRLEFTNEFQANDQTPNPNRRMFDPKAVNSLASAFARRILDGKTSWEKLLRDKEIAPCKVKDGQMTSFECTDARGRLLGIKVATVEAHVERERKRRADAEVRNTKAKAAALAENAQRMMGKGLGDLIDVVDEIATSEPTQAPAPHGRSR